MTTTYDPSDAAYLDEADVRNELSRVFDVCNGCRRCVDFCGVFPTLFQMLERFDDHDAGRLTPDQQDGLIDACFHCQRCLIDCPYTPERDAANVDVPRLLLRAEAMRDATGQQPYGRWRMKRYVGHWWRFGRLAAARPGSLRRRVLTALVGVSSERTLPVATGQRFTEWFRERPGEPVEQPAGSVTVFPTCLVDRATPSVGKDLVGVYERNQIDCSVSEAGCCGAPWLHAGDIERFRKIARRNVRTLAADVRNGREIVVPDPTCSGLIRHDYPAYLKGTSRHADAELVAAHTFDAAQYLLETRRDSPAEADTAQPDRSDHDRCVYVVSSQLRAQRVGLPARELLASVGMKVELVENCSTDASLWGLRADNDEHAFAANIAMTDQFDVGDDGVICGDSHLVNLAIAARAGRVPSHPLSIVARAGGNPTDPS